METTKKTSALAAGLKIAAVCAAIYGTMIAVGRYMAKKARELELANAGKKEKNYLAVMNGKMIKPGKEPVEKISIRTCMGGVNLDLTEAELAKETDVDIKSVMSGVNIKVPPMVRVILDGTNIMGGFANLVPEYEVEDLPTVYVYAESLMGGVSVQMVP